VKKLLIIILIILTITSVTADKIHSAKLSFAMSALVPGSGDYYARNYSKGSIALVREIALIATLFHFNNQSDNYNNSAKIFANKITGTPINSSSHYYDLLALYVSSSQYNENVRLNGQNYYGYGTDGYYEFVNNYSISNDDAWNWESKKNLNKYKKYRANKQKNKQNASFVIGAIIVNHLYSAISSAVVTNSNNKSFIQNHSLNIQPDLTNRGVTLSYGYKF